MTESAKLNIKLDIWGKAAEFKKAIANEAVNAQVTKWEFLGTRSEADWPRTFHYNTSDNRFTLLVMPGMLAVASVFYLWKVGSAFFRTLPVLGLGWALATVGILLFGILPLALMSGLVLRIRNATARHRISSLPLILTVSFLRVAIAESKHGGMTSQA